MVKKDFELLNEAYAKQINELNMGPGAQGGPSEGLSPEKRVKVNKLVKDGVATGVSSSLGIKKQIAVQVPASGTAPNQPATTATVTGPAAAEPQQAEPQQAEQEGEDENCEECGGMCDAEHEDADSYSYMAKQLIYRIFKLSAMLYPLMKPGSNIEAWVLSKITNAHDQLNSVFNYKDFESFRNQITAMNDTGGLQEETEIDLYNAIVTGGDHLLDSLKHKLKNESKETKEKLFLEVLKQLEG
jgi:hypothetical protein